MYHVQWPVVAMDKFNVRGPKTMSLRNGLQKPVYIKDGWAKQLTSEVE